MIYKSPMRPPNLLKVLGMRKWRFTSISTFLAVWMYTWSIPARFRGLSNNIMRHWWEMSGLADDTSRPCFTNGWPWSSLFISSNFFPICINNTALLQELVWIVCQCFTLHLDCFQWGIFKHHYQSFLSVLLCQYSWNLLRLPCVQFRSVVVPNFPHASTFSHCKFGSAHDEHVGGGLSREAHPQYRRCMLEDGASEGVSEALACHQCEQPGFGVLQTEWSQMPQNDLPSLMSGHYLHRACLCTATSSFGQCLSRRRRLSW